MLVGWGGNNGSTITAALEANRNQLEWRTKDGIQRANWFGSVTQASTILLGNDSQSNEIYVPFNHILPMVNPNDIGMRAIFLLILSILYQYHSLHCFFLNIASN